MATAGARLVDPGTSVAISEAISVVTFVEISAISVLAKSDQATSGQVIFVLETFAISDPVTFALVTTMTDVVATKHSVVA